MAINKITAPLSTSPAVFAAPVVNQLLALSIASERHTKIVNGVIRKGSMFCILGDLFVADSDTAISGTESGSVAVRLTVSGNIATAEYVTENSVTWNGAYGGYYDTSNRLYVYDYVYLGDSINMAYGVRSQSGYITFHQSDIGTEYSYAELTNKIKMAGKHRVVFTLNTKGVSTYSGAATIFKNGAVIGTVRTQAGADSNNNPLSRTYSEDFLFEEGDVIDVRLRAISPGTVMIFLGMMVTDLKITNQAGA